MMRKFLYYLILCSIPAVWIYVFYRIDGGFTFGGVLIALFLSAITVAILYLLAVVAVQVKNGEAVFRWEEPRPRKLPLWYRILSKIFR